MPPHPVIVPLPSVPAPALRASIAALQMSYGLTPTIGHPRPIPTVPTDTDTDVATGRDRYRPRPILTALSSQARPATDANVEATADGNGAPAAARESSPGTGTGTGSTSASGPGTDPDTGATSELTVVITDAALSHPELGEVFGLAHLGEPECLISTRLLRLAAHAPLRPVADDRFARRVRKLVVHEVGHTLGLPHCDTTGCVLQFSPTLQALDDTDPELCPSCRRQLAATTAIPWARFRA